MSWHLYMVECADGSLYTGIATDVVRRVVEHNGAAATPEGVKAKGKGARYTATRRPVRLVYQEPHATRSDALKAERRMKRLPRDQKCLLIASAQKGTVRALTLADPHIAEADAATVTVS